MKVIVIKANNNVKAVPVFTQKSNEIQWADIRKLLAQNVESLYLNRISRLAFLYLMFAEKGGKDRPVNKLATILLNDPAKLIYGDVVITRTDHLGTGSKIIALDDEEIKKIVERISYYSGVTVELTN